MNVKILSLSLLLVAASARGAFDFTPLNAAWQRGTSIALPLAQQHQVATALAAGYAVRAAAMNFGSYAADGAMLGTFNSAIPLWVGAREATKQLMAVEAGTLQAELTDLAYSSGMDSFLLYQTLQDTYTAVNKINEAATTESFSVLSQSVALTASTLAGLAGLYASFNKGSVVIAQRMKLSPIFATLIIFNVGLTLASMARKGFFALGDAVGLTSECTACQAAYTVGEDLSYLITGIIPGYIALYKATHQKIKAS